MRIAFDTNILFCIEASADDPRHVIARELHSRLLPTSIVIPAQVIGELYRVLVRKAQVSRSIASSIVSSWHLSYEIAETDADSLSMAIELATTHQLEIWDAVVLASAVNAGCRILFSEDLHHGFSWADITVINPFHSPRHPLLEELLVASSG